MSPPLDEWHDYFMILGTASATLIGAMFVVVSIGIGILSRDRPVTIRVFLTTTVIHLSTVLFGCMLTLVPVLEPHWQAIIAGVAGLAGVAYSVHVFVGFREHRGTVLSDWFGTRSSRSSPTRYWRQPPCWASTTRPKAWTCLPRC
jgi:hypothetical protein